MNRDELKQRLIELLSTAGWNLFTGGRIKAEIADHLIANGVTIRERGEWRLCKSDCMYVCSRCGYPVHPREQEEWDFCPKCGADNRGGKDE